MKRMFELVRKRHFGAVFFFTDWLKSLWGQLSWPVLSQQYFIINNNHSADGARWNFLLSGPRQSSRFQ